VEQAARYSADPDQAPLWYSNIKWVRWQTPRPMQIGSLIEFIAHFLGKRLAYTYEIVEVVPGTRLIMRTAEELLPMETTYTWEAAGENATRMTFAQPAFPSDSHRSWRWRFDGRIKKIWRSSRSASNRPAPNNRKEPLRQAPEQSPRV